MCRPDIARARKLFQGGPKYREECTPNTALNKGLSAWIGVILSRGLKLKVEELWHGIVWHGAAWYDMVWNGMVWYGMLWHGMVWHGMA